MNNLIILLGTTPKECPIEAYYVILDCVDGEPYVLPSYSISNDGLGEVSLAYIPERAAFSTPKTIDVLWLSLKEHTVFSLKDTFDVEYIARTIITFRKIDASATYLIIGFAPNARVYLWIKNSKKSKLIYRGTGVKKLVSDNESPVRDDCTTISEYCIKLGFELLDDYSKAFYDSTMREFNYRYVVRFGKWNGKSKQWEEYGEKEQLPEFGWIEEALFDGTHDKLRDGGLMKYHEAGKPKKLAVSWHIGKTEYSAYFWFEDERIREVFDRFYGAHPDTKTDFIIRIDAERRKYELALYRYGLKEPQVIPEDVYQLLVFKNKFEDYRSDNYNQERGSWIW